MTKEWRNPNDEVILSGFSSFGHSDFLRHSQIAAATEGGCFVISSAFADSSIPKAVEASSYKAG
jgi:hypothetical protein